MKLTRIISLLLVLAFALQVFALAVDGEEPDSETDGSGGTGEETGGEDASGDDADADGDVADGEETDGEETEEPETDEPYVRHIPETYQFVMENEILQIWAYSREPLGTKGSLDYKHEDPKFTTYESVFLAVVDKRDGGFQWFQTPVEGIYNKGTLTSSSRNMIDSLCHLTTTDLNKNNDQTRYNAMLNDKPQTAIVWEVLPVEGVQTMRIYFINPDNYYNYCIDYQLDGANLIVRVPNDMIGEGTGSANRVQRSVDKILNFTNALKAAADKVRNDPELKRYSGGIKKLDKAIKTFEDLMNGIDSVIGIEMVSIKAKELFKKVKTAFKGGLGAEGVLKRLIRDTRLSSGKRAEYKSIYDDLSQSAITADLQLATLKAIRASGIVSFELMQYFGAIADHEDGYVLFPDGSGALAFAKEEHSETVQTAFIDREVYSEDSIDIAWMQDKRSSGYMNVSMPYFGIKNGNNAFIAAVTSGSEYSTIEFHPSSYNGIKMHRAFAKFRFRRTVAADTIAGIYANRTYEILDKKRLNISPEVTYMFLVGDEANYNGMAKRYREYLISTGQLAKSPLMDQETMPLTMDALGLTKISMMLYNKNIPMTSFDNLRTILEDLNKNGVKNIMVNYYGWTSDGYGRFPGKREAAAPLGGSSAMKKLNDYAKANGTILFLEDEYALVTKNISKVSRDDMAQGTNYKVIETVMSDKALLSAPYALNMLNTKTLPLFSDWGVSGIMFTTIGGYLYYDYTPKRNTQREDMIEHYKKLLGNTQAKLGYAAVTVGNQYTLSNADWIMDCDISSTGFMFTDMDIPFYQMVVHGYIPYTSKAFNEFYDKSIEKLKIIEYGCLPFYRITHEDSVKLIDTFLNYLLSTMYEDWRDSMIADYKEFNQNLSSVWNKLMIGYEKITADVSVTTYEGNIKVIVNYGLEPFTYEGVTVGPRDYAVKK